MADKTIEDYLGEWGHGPAAEPAAPAEAPAPEHQGVEGAPERTPPPAVEAPKPPPVRPSVKQPEPRQLKLSDASPADLKKGVISSLLTAEPTSEQKFNDSMGRTPEQQEMASASRAGFEQGFTDPYYGLKQKGAHILRLGDMAPRADMEVEDRELAYRKATAKHPIVAGVNRAIGNVLPAVLTGGVTAPVTAAVIGAGMGLSQPITDTSKESFGKQTAEQGITGAVTSMIPNVVKEGFKYLMRGGEEKAANMVRNIADWRRAGVDEPTLGQVTEAPFVKSAGASKDIITRQKAQVEAKATQIADKLSRAKTPEQAGDMLIDELQGVRATTDIRLRSNGRPNIVETGGLEGGWIGKFHEKQGVLHNKAMDELGPDTRVSMSNTFEALKGMTTPSASAPATTSHMINSDTKRFFDSIQHDSPDGTLTAKDVKRVRSWLGEQTDPTNLHPSMSAAEANKLYGAFSEDMMKAAQAKGPKAELAMRQALQYSRTGFDAIERHYQPVIDKKLPEQAFTEATRGTKEGASRLNKIMEALDPAKQDVVRSVILREMGRKGADWDPGTFFKSWKDLHPDARTTLFGPEGANLRTSIDKVAKAANSVARGGTTLSEIREFALNHEGVGELGALAFVTHHYGISNFLFGGAGLGFLSGRLIKNPVFMKWLAQTETKNPTQIGTAMAALARRKQGMSDEDQQEVRQYLNNLNSFGKKK